MENRSSDITYFGETDFRGKKVPFGIKREDRTKHMYVIGKTGMGKSTLLENMAIQDIKNGEGFAFIDPHGKTAELFLDYIPPERVKDVIYFAPFDLDYPVSFNVMEDVGKDQRHLVANGLMATFKKIWPDVWSGRMEYILGNTILALLEYPNSTLLGVNRMLSEKKYRDKVVDNVQDPTVKAFWVDEFAKYSEKYMQEAGDAIKNKIGQFTGNPLIRNIIGQPKSSFDIREVMDNKKILIINLSKGRVGELNANLIGGMIVTKIYLAAMSRAELHETEIKKLPNFYLYVDEFQSFVNESFANILSEARKYKLNLTIAHQYIEQLPEEVRDAVFGNVGTTIAFRVGPFDAEVLEKVFAPKFMQQDLVGLGFAQIYLTLMIDGVGSPPFSAKTLPPIPALDQSNRDKIIESSRKLYAKPRVEVEKAIVDYYEEERAPAAASGSATAKSPAKLTTAPIKSESGATRSADRPPKPEWPKPLPDIKIVPPRRDTERAGQPKVTPSVKTEKPVSLAALAKKATPAVTDHKENLRHALGELLKNKPAEPAKVPTVSKTETPPSVAKIEKSKIEASTSAEPATKSGESSPKQTSEVPEDVLRALLQV